jgi:subtilisin family serine protease
MPRLCTLLLLLLLAAHGAASSLQFPYYKTFRTVEVDTTRVAVWQNPMRASASLGAAELDLLSVERHAIRGWQLGEIRYIRRTEVGARVVLEEVAENRQVDFVSPVLFDAAGAPLLITPDVFVKFARGTSPESAARQLQAFGTLVESSAGGMNDVYRIRSFSRNGYEVLAQASEIAQWDDVVFAEPDTIFSGRGSYTPTDPSFPLSWGLHNTGQFSGSTMGMDMKATLAWDSTLGSSSIRVVVLDTGVQQNHPDLNLIPGMDFTTDGGDGSPRNSHDNHGTPVAGCISAIANNGIGTLGIAPNCVVASARPFIGAAGGQWTTQASWTVNALQWASTIGARVTNNSNGYNFTSALIENKYNETRAAGMVHFGSAGNEGSTTISYPARLSSVMAIGAVHFNGAKAGFSNTGPEIALGAPGTQVYSTDRTGVDGYNTSPGLAGNYTYVQGTSFASPYAAGVAALILSVNPSLSAQNVETIMKQQARDLGPTGFDQQFGHGLVNADASVSAAIPLSSLTVSPTSVPGGTNSTGTVVATHAAPASGWAVQLTSSNPTLATVPPAVTIAAGATSANFSISTSGASAVQTVTISGSMGRVTRSATLTIVGVRLQGLSLSPTAVTSGNSSTATVSLTGPAPAGGAQVTVTPGSTVFTVPSSVTIPAGSSSTTFTVGTTPIGFDTTRGISVTYGGDTRTANLTLHAYIGLHTFSVSPTEVEGGSNVLGSVRLTAPAPPSGANIVLSSSSSVLIPPASVGIAGGQTVATFNIATRDVGAIYTRTLTARYNNVTKYANITIRPAVRLSSLTLSPTTVRGGESTTGTVLISFAAPPGGKTIALQANSSAISTPAHVLVPAEATTATFTASTSRVGATFVRTISATYNGVTKTASLTLTP